MNLEKATAKLEIYG